MLIQLGKNLEGLVVLPVVEESTDFVDRLACLNRLLHLVDGQRTVHMLLGTVWHLLQLLEVNHSWLHVVVGLLLLLQLHTHQLILHLHELVGHHAELLILWVVAASLRVEHLHVHHIGVDIVHSLTGEAHLVLHHHTWELVHVLHAVDAHRRWHLVAHSLAVVSHL